MNKLRLSAISPIDLVEYLFFENLYFAFMNFRVEGYGPMGHGKSTNYFGSQTMRIRIQEQEEEAIA